MQFVHWLFKGCFEVVMLKLIALFLGLTLVASKLGAPDDFTVFLGGLTGAIVMLLGLGVIVRVPFRPADKKKKKKKKAHH